MYVDFEKLPDHSRVWVYQAERSLNPEEIEIISSRLKKFCEGWNTHGNMMPTSFSVLDDQILILAVDESGLGASGCSIDSSVRVLTELERLLQINLTDRGKVSFKAKEGFIRVTPALGIKSQVQAGEISPETLVINPQIQTKADIQELWVSAGKSWLNKYFPN
ncbi:hypothetical protein [Algoriphagus sp. CAU 1675]|uniref:hypothetical protein n=1 Tax=Algoriphagus sp. CAU 1675 TaxID=3032597 RepID=UPI0023DA54F0|nr:hypothetical protein [Algoriphagus sp. CAU 1675]MDF2158837.1 hypothetical protein [Algoriphagus sp. CAU 1675]